jgi:hypothetical protein
MAALQLFRLVPDREEHSLQDFPPLAVGQFSEAVEQVEGAIAVKRSRAEGPHSS